MERSDQSSPCFFFLLSSPSSLRGFTLMSSLLSKSLSAAPPSAPSSANPPTNPNSAQLKKLLASPKKEFTAEPTPATKPLQSPPSLDSSVPNDPDDFMNQLSQNTVSFHASTHSGGRPISPSLQRFAASPSPVEDTSKTRALAQVLSLNSNSSTSTAKKATPPSAAPITGIAISQHSNGKRGPAAPSADLFPTDREIGAKSRVSVQQNQVVDRENGKIDSSALLAPSDLTGCPFSFPF
jgi:hypothetical protein